MAELHPNLLKSKPSMRLLLVVGLLLVVIAVALYTLGRIKEQSREDVREKLQEVLNTTHEATQNWINDRIDSVQLVTERPEILRLAKDLLSTPDKSQEALSKNISLQKMRSIMRPWLGKHSYLGIFVISPDGINVASMRDENLGEKTFFSKHGNYLDNMLKGSPQIVIPLRSEVALPNKSGKLVRGEPTMFIGAPIYDDEGSVIAAFTIRINPALDFTRAIQMARTGETGDSYAFNQNGALISEVRFNEHLRKIGLLVPVERAILNLTLHDPGGNMVNGYIPKTPREELPLTLMAQQATAEKSGYNVDGYRDYRGVPVVGAWLWNDKFNFGLAFEIDEDEAYFSYYSIRKSLINVLLFAIVLFLSIFLLIIFFGNWKLKLVRESLRSKLFVLLMTTSFISVSLIGYLSLNRARGYIKESQLNALEVNHKLKTEKIELFFQERINNIKEAQDYYNVKTNLPIVSKLSSNRKNPQFIDAKNMLDNQLRTFQEVYGYLDVMLADKEGNIVYVTNEEHWEKDLDRPLIGPTGKAFVEGRKGIYLSEIFIVSNKNFEKNFEMLITAPIYDFNGEFEGVLVLETNMEPIYKLIQDTKGLGKTGETVVGKKIGNEVVFLNPFRHDPGAALKRKVLIGSKQALPMQNALKGMHGMGQSVDYRGVNIIAYWNYIDLLDWGFVTKIDLEEAFSAEALLKSEIAGASFFLITFIAVLSFWISKKIVKPIDSLKKFTMQISKGNFSDYPEVKTKDELGQLSNSFIEMMGLLNDEAKERKKAEMNLQIHQGHLEENVKKLQTTQKQLKRKNSLNESISLILAGRLKCKTEKELGKLCLEVAEALSGSKFGFFGEINSAGLFDSFAVSNPGMDECKVPEGELTLSLFNMEIQGVDRGTMREGKSRIVNSEEAIKNHPDHVELPEGHPAVTAFLGVPFIQEGKTIGMIGLGNKEGGYTIEDQENIEALSVTMMEALRSFRKEAEVNKLNKKLKKQTEEIIKVNEEMGRAKIEAESANQSKRDFLARMSHEIRTPMNAIIGMGQLALMTDLTTKQQNYLNKIESSSYNLLGIINDILDFSKIEAGKLEIEHIDFDLEDVLENLTNLLIFKAEEKGIELILSIFPEVPYSLVGDPLRLGQVLTNLGNNALKFTEKGEIIIAAKRKIEGPQDKVVIQFSVKDTGIGLTRKQIGKLFQSFTQAEDSITRKYGGSGLGLTICKHLVEMMGGDIWVESIPGKGSIFNFTTPFVISKQKKERVFEPVEDLIGMKVLVVDDCESTREALTQALKSFTLDPVAVNSGREAIRELERVNNQPEERPYELVLMDWKMPEMDGIETAQAIKKNPSLEKIPFIIMVTAYGREAVKEQADAVGIKGFLLKPVSHSPLFNTIMEVFGHKTKRMRKGPKQTRIEDIEGIKEIQGTQVLLVEDNEINQMLATELLEKAGIIITIANNGKEAIEKLNSLKFDLVLMDVQMPVMSGLEATKEIRKDSQHKDLPIIAMTAQAMAGDREKCLEVGMNDYVSKPIEINELFSTLVEWIKPGEKKTTVENIQIKVSQEQEIILPDLPIIDVELGVKRLGGDRRFYKKILTIFQENHSDSAKEVKENLDNGKLEDAKRLAHTIKGNAGSLGAGELQKTAAALEKGIKKGKRDQYQGLLENFKNSLNKALNALKNIKPMLKDKG